jgi:hypothetical protein
MKCEKRSNWGPELKITLVSPAEVGLIYWYPNQRGQKYLVNIQKVKWGGITEISNKIHGRGFCPPIFLQ